MVQISLWGSKNIRKADLTLPNFACVNGASFAYLCMFFSPLSSPVVSISEHPKLALAFEAFSAWPYCLEGILAPHPSNIHACSILGLKIQISPFSVLIQPMGLLGNQVAESMTHPDARELSSLIINTLGSYELKKGMWGVWIWYVHPL